MDTKETYSTTEAAEYLNTSVTSLEELIAAGELPAAKIGKAYVLQVAALRDYLRAETERQTAERREHARRVASGRWLALNGQR